jgi:hypothetical protein
MCMQQQQNDIIRIYLDPTLFYKYLGVPSVTCPEETQPIFFWKFIFYKFNMHTKSIWTSVF